MIDMLAPQFESVVSSTPGTQIQFYWDFELRGWCIIASGPAASGLSYRLSRQRGGPRAYRSLDTAVAYLKRLGYLSPLTAQLVDQGAFDV